VEKVSAESDGGKVDGAAPPSNAPLMLVDEEDRLRDPRIVRGDGEMRDMVIAGC
jgi:hypothetical protein